MAATSKVRKDLAQQFLNALNQGQIPWKACWSQDRPLNAVTGKNYRGINAFVLSYFSTQRGYIDPRWCTYRQAQEKGWQVRKGEKGVRVEYWAYYDSKEKKLLSWEDVRKKLRADPDYEKHLQLRCRTYTVFNGEQMDGIPALQRNKTDIGLLRDRRDLLIRNMGIRYQEFGTEAYYSPAIDMVTLPPEGSFDDTYSYMATFLHECGHATGAEHRLNRDLTGGFGSESYAREELRAEIASAFTAQSIGLQLTEEQLSDQVQRHAAYIQHWAAILKDSPDELFRAIKSAEEISDYLLAQLEFQPEPDVQRGTMGEVNYTLSPLPEGEGMLLRIHGEGAIPDFDNVAARPYQAHAAAIRKVVIGDKITAIGAGALSDLPSLERLSRPRSVQWIRPQDLETIPTLKEIKFTGAKQPSENYRYIHSPRDLVTLVDKYTGFTVEQLNEIAAGIQEGLSAEQISVYARHEFTPLQMNALRYCAASSLAPEQLTLIANPSFDSVQMDILRSSFNGGMTIEQVSAFAKPEIPAQQMLDFYWQIQNDPNWVPTLPAEPIEPPMEQIPEKISLDEYLGQRGLLSPVDDFMLDKHRLPHGETRRQQSQRQYEAQASSEAYHNSREQAVAEYKELVSKGAIISPSAIEQKLVAARGRPENETVRAARRSLEKRGINWITRYALAAPSQDMIEAVHHWESRNFALMPEDLSTTIVPETSQVTVRPGQCSLLIHRYQEHCCPSFEQHFSEDPLVQAEREFWEMDDYLKKGGDIADLADWYEKDLDLEL